MQKRIQIKLLPQEAANAELLAMALSSAAGISTQQLSGYHLLKQSVDARGRNIWVNLTANVFIDEPMGRRSLRFPVARPISASSPKAVVIGAGPAGLFAALRLLELGIKPIIAERGKDVQSRRRDLAAMNKQGIVNAESNYCFGEGGAGTYSDGKLYTRSRKRGDVDLILEYLHHFGAAENILYQAHPHIGTNKLPQVITAIRQFILLKGGEIHFEKKLEGLQHRDGILHAACFADGDVWPTEMLVLATGHSAADVFELLHTHKFALEAKPLAIGVRVEHPQQLVDAAQYHCSVRPEALPPAAYSLVEQVEGRGVFSFCMCPGGIIAPASTKAGQLVVNGWSPSRRNNPFANSGMVVEVRMNDLHAPPPDFKTITGKEPDVLTGVLGMLYYQQYIEQKAWKAGGGNLKAPAQSLSSLVSEKKSFDLPKCSYLPGVTPSQLRDVLPAFIYDSLKVAIGQFGKRIKGYVTDEAIAVATESRTSSPVRIPRNDQTLQHPQLQGLFPCAEGAGYAGGIVSAAIDGMRVADAIAISIGQYFA